MLIAKIKLLSKSFLHYYEHFGLLLLMKSLFLKIYYKAKYKFLSKKLITSANHKILDFIIKSNKKVIVSFSIISWNYRFQRPQHILTAFSNDSEYIILYIDTSFVNSKETIISKLTQNIYNVNLALDTPYSIYSNKLSGNILNQLYSQVSNVLDHINTKEILYFLQFPNWYNLLAKIKEKINGKVVFDFMDEHSGFTTTTDAIKSSENDSLINSDLVVASSNFLYEKALSKNKNSILVHNGTEFKHFNNLKGNNKLNKFSNKPIVGYFGAIAEWFDTELLHYIAQNRPQYNFILIGSTVGSKISDLKKLSNVFFLKEINYNELPSYLYYFNVCIIPFKITPLTIATNPVKFYEYISSGKPVVSTKLPELEKYTNYCYLANTKDEFVTFLDKALAENDFDIIKNRINLAKKNSWASRYKQIKMACDNL
jgi:hypothetical protein